MMRPAVVFAIVTAATLAGAPGFAAAQSRAKASPPAATPPTASAPDRAPARLTPIWLAHPAYPPIARAARVQGLVIVEVEVASNGQVASAKVTRGIPLLDHAALEGANESHFICDGCGPGNLPYTLVFDFRFDDAPPLASDITPERSHIIVAASNPVIDVQMARR